MVSREYLWPTLRCRRVAGVSPLLSIGWWYLSSVSPKRHCCRVSAADKECRVYPLDPRTDAVVLYSGCTPESVPTTSNSEHSNAPEIPQCVKRNPRNRRKRPKVQKPEIEIKMTPHTSRKSAPTEYATDEEDIITYDVEEEELVPDPTFKFTFKESLTSYPKGYLRELTPTRFRKSRS
ncbi:uncharacterized protein TNCV_4650431 [Trichonephila clavipes]|nr:uncharacterized protein TNCV_4650431 [Trichonephila clavipes]